MSISSIIGHKKNKELFFSFIKNDKLSHSYLFEGDEGIGKKKFAYEFAKYILCENAVDDSCGVCSSCVKINSLNHLDFMFIESEGSIKNEIIEEFQKFIMIRPNESKYKVVIIDNADMMTISAQNRILKILEEPPSYVIIFLITSKSSSIVKTIKSRCQHINFSNLDYLSVEKYLMDLGIDEEKAKVYSKFSNGSLLKALKIANSEIFLKLREDVDFIIEMLLEQKIVKIFDFLKKFDDLKQNGMEILNLMEIYFRDLLFLNYLKDESMIFNVDKLDKLLVQSKKFNSEKIVKFIDYIVETKDKLDKYVNYSLCFEDLFLKIQED